MDSMSENNQAGRSQFHKHGLQLRPGEPLDDVEKRPPKKKAKVKTGCYTCKQVNPHLPQVRRLIFMQLQTAARQMR